MWLDTIADNVANINTVHPAGEEPFRARLVHMTEQRNSDGAGAGVKVTEIVKSSVENPMVYDPSHPFADENGNVAMSNVDLGVEMTNLLLAERGYQANLRVIEQARTCTARRCRSVPADADPAHHVAHAGDLDPWGRVTGQGRRQRLQQRPEASRAEPQPGRHARTTAGHRPAQRRARLHGGRVEGEPRRPDTVALRDKAVEAYQEIMRMQV